MTYRKKINMSNKNTNERTTLMSKASVRRIARPAALAGEPASTGFPVPKRERLADSVYGRMLQQITAGRLEEGHRLPSENDLAGFFGVSRSVVREALLRLQNDGIVASRQGSGTYVQKKPPARLTELGDVSNIAGVLRCYEARLAVEGETARLAALRRSEADAAALAQILDALDAESRSNAIERDTDFAFHRQIAVASRNEFLLGLFDALAEGVTTGMKLALGLTRTLPGVRSRRVFEEHERIYDAVVGGDSESAGIAMRYHLDQARKRLIDSRRQF